MPMTQYYHVRDPMENLRISVTIRKISGFGSDSSGDSVPVGRTWKYCFRWQEKKLSMSETKREQESLEARGIQLSNRKRGDRNLPKIANADILSTYVDVDDYVPKEERPSTSMNTTTHLIPPDLTRRPRDRRNESSWTSNQHRAWLRANREDKFRAMHIVALIEEVERVLCSFRFYKESGLFCATPGFSAPIVDPESDPDLFVKGPKLTTFHVSTPSGSLYEYVLDNTNDLLPFASAEDQRLAREIRLQEEKRDTTEVSRWQQLDNPPKLVEARPGGSGNTKRKLMLSLEVVTVDNPQTMNPVFVEYKLVLPHGMGHLDWKLQPGNFDCKRGRTPLSLPQQSPSTECGSSSAAFGWLEHFDLKLIDVEKSLLAAETSSQAARDADFGNIIPAPILYLSVYSLDWWRRKHTEGHGEIELQGSSGFYDFDVPIRKPITSIRDHMEELFLGIGDSDTDQDWNADRSHDREICTDESPISTIITSRLGQKSESTGSTVRIRWSIFDLRPATHANGIVKVMPAASVAPLANTKVVKRSVQEILQSVKLEKRLASIPDVRVQTALRSVPAGGVAATESLIDQSALV